jgi:hypothetical protein
MAIAAVADIGAPVDGQVPVAGSTSTGVLRVTT